MIKKIYQFVFNNAGFNPEELRGTRTGVYIGLMTTEANDYAESSPETLTGYETIGSTRAMLANRLSYAFHFSGKIRYYYYYYLSNKHTYREFYFKF